MLHDGNRAAAEFQKFIDHRGMVRNSQIGILARLGLARAYAMLGDTTKACAADQDFLTTWKDADPDLPILIQAKAEVREAAVIRFLGFEVLGKRDPQQLDRYRARSSE